MTMHRKPSRRGQDQQSNAFINQVSAAETVPLHCLIPQDIHKRMRLLAVQEDTTITKLVLEALDTLLAHRA